MKKFNYITEVLTKDDIDEMLDHKNGFTLVVSPTGTGKSTFIIEEIIKPNFENENHAFGEGKYQRFAKKSILVMANRTAVVLKFNEDVERACEEMGIFQEEGITVASYQKVTNEEMLKVIDEAEIIICDEAHYFISDAWNGTTHIIVNKLLQAAEEKPVIFFTATSQIIKEYFNYKELVYKEFDYRNVLGFNDRMDFICTNKDLEQIIRDIPKTEKAIAFVEDRKSKIGLRKKCEKLRKYGYDVEYYHSIWIKDSDGVFRGKKNLGMAEKVGLLVMNCKFDVQIALANKAIDNGIDLKDLNLKHIILLNQFDHVQIQQMVGRKRFDIHNPNDRLTVWFTTEGNPVLEKTYQHLLTQVRIANKYWNYRTLHLDSCREALRPLPANQGKTEEKFERLVQNVLFESFISEGDNLSKMEEAKLTQEQVENEEYIGLLLFQLKYISPLVRKYLVDVYNEDGTFETIEKQNIVRNYQELVKQLFGRPSTVQWRNKEEMYAETTKLLQGRVSEELTPYLQKLEGSTLFGDEKSKFETEISYYFGASKRSRLASLTTINEFIYPHGFSISDKRKMINQKKQTVWTIEAV